jgi:small-conductance mechanosensitive channel
LEELLDEHAPALLRKTLVMALQGQVPLLRMLMQHTLPRPHDSPVKIGRLPMGDIEELLQSHETVMNKLASGEITPIQAVQIDSMLETRRRLFDTQDLARRVSALEQFQGSNQPA